MKIKSSLKHVFDNLLRLEYTSCVNSRESHIKNGSCKVSWMSFQLAYIYAVIGNDYDIILVLRKGLLSRLFSTRMQMILLDSVQAEDPDSFKQYRWNHLDAPFA